MTTVIKYDLALPVTVRKYEVDIEGLRNLLRERKTVVKLTNRLIAGKLERPNTEVEHWFRTDKCFSIPDADIWFELKELLNIEIDDYDLPVTEFIEKEGVFEKANRFYDVDGIAPTLTVASADEKIIIPTGVLYKDLKESGLMVNSKVINNKPFTYVELFAGIGGVSFGFDKVGGKCVMASEIDKYATKAYNILHPNVDLQGDVIQINENDVPDHDILSFTTPCQSFSVAGKRLGFEDARGTLVFEALRIAKHKQPKILFMENVKGLVNHDSGRTLDTILSLMSEIGYTVDYNVLNSKFFGVPQNRERVFIVGIRNDLIQPEPWIIKGNNIVAKAKKRIDQLTVNTFNFNWPEQENVTARLRDILENRVDEKFYLSEEKTAKLVSQLERNVSEHTVIEERSDEGVRIFKDNICGTLRTISECGDKRIIETKVDIKSPYHFPTPDGINNTLRNGGKGLLTAKHNYEHIAEPTYKVKSVGNVNPSGNGMNGQVYDAINGISPTITTNKGEGLKVMTEVRACLTPDREEKRQNGRRFKKNDEESFTINTQDRHGVATGNYPTYRIRKLTPKECFRLQGFADSEFDKLVAAGISNSQLYKMAGNAVTVSVIEAIGERLLPYLHHEKIDYLHIPDEVVSEVHIN